MPLPLVAIVGRPNVGKSTLFNRIVRRLEAVTDPLPGVTRDRHYILTEWNGIQFTLVDTGGWVPAGQGDALAKAICEQTIIAADEADLVLFVVDAISGLTDTDRQLARLLLDKKIALMFIINKVDDPLQLGSGYEAATLGLGEPFLLSAKTGYAVADMLDQLAARLQRMKPEPPRPPDPAEMSIAIIGAPNAGKSSLVNKLTGSERMVVSEMPGTTRDAVDTIIQRNGRIVRLIDTAGLRRKRFGLQGIDFYTTLRSLKAIERCDVAVVLIDGSAGITAGDIRLVNQAATAGAGVMAVVNKWDLIKKDAKTADEWLKEWKRRYPQLTWVPLLFVSALTGQRAAKIIDKGFEIKAQRERRLNTTEINDKIVARLISQPPPAIKGKNVRVKYGAQVGVNPPRFIFFTSHSKLVTANYIRFTERIIRQQYGFEGVPLRIWFREK